MEAELAKHVDPLPGRVGHVAGIESLTLDGHRYYFGFDYGSDMVVSPLIDDPDAMAAFASEHLRQTTGRHDRAYWADLVASAVESSALVSEEAQREWTTEGLRVDLPAPGGHLLYLLGAATEWDDWFAESPPAQQAYQRLGFEEEDSDFVDHCLEAVRDHGVAARPDEWTVIRFHLTAAVQHLPGNWRLLFDPLAEGVASYE
ncbi:hypothetical protein [Kitasatospora sp. NPDC088548]|uniref:hypothetical protein n=1 Tax=Kitasatospora sp. NPDC088548 TaxID=3364075 RepID=UPI0038103AF3